MDPRRAGSSRVLTGWVEQSGSRSHSRRATQSADHSLRLAVDIAAQVAFPQSQDAPASRTKLGHGARIPLGIGGELRLPERSVRFGVAQTASRTSVPKAPVDENGELGSRVRKVGPTG